MCEFSLKSKFCRYLLHGTLFSLVFVGFEITKMVVFITLIAFWSIIGSAVNIITFSYALYSPDWLKVIGFLIGLALSCGVLPLIVGGLNSVLAVRLWRISVKADWKRLSAHGLILLFILVIVHIPTITVDFSKFMSDFFSVFAITMFVLIPYSLIDGFLAKNVASLWMQEAEEFSEQV
jgi:hypothetical protein